MIKIGTLLYGYCDGFFGRDSYGTKRIESIGVDWIVARELDENASPEFAWFDGSWSEKMDELVDEWSKKTEDD